MKLDHEVRALGFVFWDQLLNWVIGQLNQLSAIS